MVMAQVTTELVRCHLQRSNIRGIFALKLAPLCRSMATAHLSCLRAAKCRRVLPVPEACRWLSSALEKHSQGLATMLLKRKRAGNEEDFHHGEAAILIKHIRFSHGIHQQPNEPDLALEFTVLDGQMQCRFA